MTENYIDSLQTSVDSIPHVVAEVVSDSTLHNISSMVETTANNTAFGWLPEGLDLTIAIVALIFSVVTWLAQWRTEHNTSRLSLDQQHNLLVDLVRHLYRNLVVSYGLKVKMDDLKYAYYPSEEHLQKMKVNLNDIHLELFYRKEEQHKKMNELYLMLRNYNLEIDVFCEHFKSKSIDDDTKKRDLGTLVHKCQLLTKEIVGRMEIIWPNKLESYKEEIRKDLVDNQKKNIGNPDRYFSKPFKPYNNPESYYAILFGDKANDFFNSLEINVKKECGKNDSDQDILHMIKLDAR